MNNNLTPSPQHGRINKPESRASKILGWAANALESGKFFPATESGLTDPFAPEDYPNFAPPPDGKIASAGFSGAEEMDEYGEDRWPKNDIKANSVTEFSWTYTARHKTRRWNYFVTKDGWDPNAPLTRAQFEKEPFFMVQNEERPFWTHDLWPTEPTIHQVKMPDKKGYHIVLSVWEVADNGNAFYQVVDVNFI